jgi:hypothetical protein
MSEKDNLIAHIHDSLSTALILRSLSGPTGLVKPFARIRDSVCAVLKISRSIDQSGLQPDQVRWDMSIAGTAWCIVPNRYLVTAYHVFNRGQPRNPGDKFSIFVVPGNGPRAYNTEVIGFPVERPDVDMTVIEISPPTDFPSNIPSMNVTLDRPKDGEKVLTYGFPAPQIYQGNVDINGIWRGGNLFLLANANEGIVAGQFEVNKLVTYELNVGWHHGESGGPIIRLKSGAAFSIMQRYRNIQTQHGTMAGPHQGNALSAIEGDLRALGARII